MFGAVIKSFFGGRLLFNGEDRLGSEEISVESPRPHNLDRRSFP